MSRAVRGAQLYGRHLLAGRWNPGLCSVCEGRTLFVEEQEWLRDHYRCIRCRSIPRRRALMWVLDEVAPDWRGLAVYECSPGGQASEKLARECARYQSSHYLPDVPRGQTSGGVRSEDLESLTYSDRCFDVVVTQDVFEHVLRPHRAFREVERVLKPGGLHVFTLPQYPRPTSLVRALPSADGVEHVLPADFHADPVTRDGALVVTEWGDDLANFIEEHTGMQTTSRWVRDRRLGLDGDLTGVFVSKKG